MVETPSPERPLVVFDFDHTLYDGDSGAHFVAWLIKRSGWRKALAVLSAPLLLPLVAWMPTRRRGISGFLWLGTVGAGRDIERLVDGYIQANAGSIRKRLLVPALAVLHRHRVDGDRVLVATGAPPELARAILDFVAHDDLPVIGSLGERCLGGYITAQHCHAANKMRMIRDHGYGQIEIAYSDSIADLPLLLAARHPVVVNPKPGRVALFRRVLPAGTPILNWGCESRGGQSQSILTKRNESSL
ncbi:MAG: haloacid dehalogenase-like hydrolase [Luteimonas sp.]